ncbi:MAG: SxtJ family membrane protein [Gammaproteobacteria bacterium]|nr:SxtJ family membrane protein [Gammaproteobacteria bacterium]
MTEQITDLDKSGYRKFGLVTGSIVAVLFGLIVPFLFSSSISKWPWIIAAVLIIWAVIIPMTLKYPYRVWMKFGLIMNWINTRLILGIIFYGLFLPISIVFKLMGKDPMDRKLHKDKLSYWQQSEQQPTNNLERPF